MKFEFKLPDIGEGVVDGEIVRWLVEEGEEVKEDQPMVEVMTDKATVEIPSPRPGKILQRKGKEGEIVKVGEILVVIETGSEVSQPKAAQDLPAEEVRRPPAKEKEKVKAAPRPKTEAPALATPAVRKLARELGVEISQVEGSGPGGRITQEDVEGFAQTEKKTTTVAVAERPAKEGEEETIPYRGLRKKIGDHMAMATNTIPHFTYVEEVDVTELVRLRQEVMASAKAKGMRITYLPFIMKAVVEGLKEYSMLNATLDEKEGVIRLKKYYNLGVATAAPEGLIVPVVKEVNKKNIFQLASEMLELSEAARQGKIKLEDIRGGTFTITSLGALGGILATPIINHPEVAILGVHKISSRPVVRDGQIVARDMMYLSLSLDHRVVDGAVGAHFLHHVIRFLETPGLLSWETA